MNTLQVESKYMLSWHVALVPAAALSDAAEYELFSNVSLHEHQFALS